LAAFTSERLACDELWCASGSNSDDNLKGAISIEIISEGRVHLCLVAMKDKQWGTQAN
jgi:hypothetical protein